MFGKAFSYYEHRRRDMLVLRGVDQESAERVAENDRDDLEIVLATVAVSSLVYLGLKRVMKGTGQ